MPCRILSNTFYVPVHRTMSETVTFCCFSHHMIRDSYTTHNAPGRPPTTDDAQPPQQHHTITATPHHRSRTSKTRRACQFGAQRQQRTSQIHADIVYSACIKKHSAKHGSIQRPYQYTAYNDHMPATITHSIQRSYASHYHTQQQHYTHDTTTPH